MSRTGLWFSIDVKQFKSSPGNKWAKSCTYDEWLIYIKPTLEKRKYTDMMEWPQFGKEVFLLTVHSDQIRRCIVLAKGTNVASNFMLNASSNGANCIYRFNMGQISNFDWL
jgi:hypothetical protein